MKETYWDNKGQYQEWLDSNFDTLVPQDGKASTLEGELLRAINRLYYDAYNNGSCNNSSGAARFLQLNASRFTREVRNAIDVLYGVSNCSFADPRDELEVVLDAVIEYIKAQDVYTANEIDMWSLDEPEYWNDECDDPYIDEYTGETADYDED